MVWSGEKKNPFNTIPALFKSLFTPFFFWSRSQVESNMRRRSELFITATEGMLGIEFKMQKRIK